MPSRNRAAPGRAAPESPVLSTLANGVRVLALPMPQLRSASVAVFVRTGSRDEEARLNGISHFLEHMAFKGTARRDVQAINLDAERIGAELNAWTSKDTTVYYLNGLGRDVPAMLEQLADIVLQSTFPEAELEREREVILQELVEVDEDPQSVVSALLDVACFGKQPLARPIIGPRRNIERFTRADLVATVARRYGGARLLVAAAGDVAPARFEAQAASLFGGLARGPEDAPAAPAVHVGGLQARRRAGISQVFSSIAWPIPTLAEGHHAGLVAAMLFGGGMSAPLVDEVRERQGLAYHVAADAEVSDVHGSFIVDAITQPDKVHAYLRTVGTLLRRQAEDGVDALQLERARNQLAVQAVQKQERPSSALEAAAEQLFVHGRLETPEEALQRLHDVTAEDVRAVFARMLQAPPALAVASRRTGDDVYEVLRAALA